MIWFIMSVIIDIIKYGTLTVLSAAALATITKPTSKSFDTYLEKFEKIKMLKKMGNNTNIVTSGIAKVASKATSVTKNKKETDCVLARFVEVEYLTEDEKGYFVGVFGTWIHIGDY